MRITCPCGATLEGSTSPVGAIMPGDASEFQEFQEIHKKCPEMYAHGGSEDKKAFVPDTGVTPLLTVAETEAIRQAKAFITQSIHCGGLTPDLGAGTLYTLARLLHRAGQ